MVSPHSAGMLVFMPTTENPMKRTILAGLALSLSLGASFAQAAVHIECTAERGKCPKPPAPPAPPAPPPPSIGPAGHVMPVPPAPPAPSAPPAPPAVDLPEIPASAQAACNGKKDGTRLTLTARPGETIGGVCEREGDRMVFQLRSYHRTD